MELAAIDPFEWLRKWLSSLGGGQNSGNDMTK